MWTRCSGLRRGRLLLKWLVGGWRGREVGSLLTFADFEADIVPVNCVDWRRGELGLRCHCWFWELYLGLVVFVVEEDGGEEELMRCRGGVMQLNGPKSA